MFDWSFTLTDWLDETTGCDCSTFTLPHNPAWTLADMNAIVCRLVNNDAMEFADLTGNGFSQHDNAIWAARLDENPGLEYRLG